MNILFSLLHDATLLAAENGGAFSQINPEAIFGGVVLLVVIGFLMSGKVRLEREVRDKVEAKEEVIGIHIETISQQRETIKALTERDAETLYLLRELRQLAHMRDSDSHIKQGILQREFKDESS